MRVHDLMSRDIQGCHPDTSLAEVVRQMRHYDVGFLPVTDAKSGALRGVITDRDACMAACDSGRPMSSIPVRIAMTTDVYVCREDHDLSAVHDTMRSHRIRRLPVLDDNDLVVGVISLNDLALDASKQGGAVEMGNVARTLGALCRHAVVATA